MRVAVIGAGSWGTAVAALAGAHASVRLWARGEDTVSAIRDTGRNPVYLPDLQLPESISATTDLEAALDRAEAIVMAVPSHGFRAVLRDAVSYIPSGVPIVSLTKGIEQQTLHRMTEVVLEELDHAPRRVGVLTGPNLPGRLPPGSRRHR